MIKKMLTIFLILFSVYITAQVQTSEFSRIIRNVAGIPKSGLDVDLYEPGTSNKLYDLSEDGAIPGRYYHSTVSHGLYDIWVDGALKQEDVWVGGNKLSIIADNFNSSGEISDAGIPDSIISFIHLTASFINNYIITEAKVYRALITQTGTNAPTATVLENTLSGAGVWTRTGAGIYRFTLSSAFTENYTFLLIGDVRGDDVGHSRIHRITSDFLEVQSLDDVFTNADDLFYKTSIEIIVYPIPI